jgi:hypothetical protein
MLGQLQDAGNTTTLAHYLELLAGAGMLRGVPKFSGKKVFLRRFNPSSKFRGEWKGPSFNSERFDLGSINRRLHQLSQSCRRTYIDISK